MSARESRPHDAREWPLWEVQGHGSATGVTDPRDIAAPQEILPPWVDVRLTFADGARLDVLAVVREGRIAIEDAQADPPLTLEGFAALAEAIDVPLRHACQVVTGPHRPNEPPPLTETPGLGGGEARAVSGPTRGAAVTREAPVPDAAVHGAPVHDLPVSDVPVSDVPVSEMPVSDVPVSEMPVSHLPTEDLPSSRAVPLLDVPGIRDPRERQPDPPESRCPPGAAEPPGTAAPVAAAPVWERPTAAGYPEPGPVPGPEPEREAVGRHRARPTSSRGSAARRGVAEIYRAAQREGQDPVLAVMSATGFSRRKSLRLIAGARDAGHLTPRHHRR
ncbi:hypothetical protein GCM10009654_15710 [Streptomyces hebeiensis]|uniref:Uncharacterized protein n=1 Tax=Streptomyces hebeiensis TaxID=229486 RepID=A0ABN1UQR5_9ACTN